MAIGPVQLLVVSLDGPHFTGRVEHLWADPLRDAIARAGGVPVSDRWVHPLDLVEVGLMRAEELEPA
jgi:hypothetical protein